MMQGNDNNNQRVSMSKDDDMYDYLFFSCSRGICIYSKVLLFLKKFTGGTNVYFVQIQLEILPGSK